MRAIIIFGCLALLTCGSFGQTFGVAVVKPSSHMAGKDARGHIATGSDRLSGKNVTLKELIAEAYHVELYQVSGGPDWLDSAEFDIEAKADVPAGNPQLRLMLAALLKERFHLALHRDTKELRVYALGMDKNGPKIHPAKNGDSGAAKLFDGRSFHGNLHQLARVLSIQLSIPALSDPGRPSIASGSPVPVVDETGLEGIFDIA